MHWIDPDHLPETSGVMECFLLNGEDDMEVHFGNSGAAHPL